VGKGKAQIGIELLAVDSSVKSPSPNIKKKEKEGGDWTMILDEFHLDRSPEGVKKSTWEAFGEIWQTKLMKGGSSGVIDGTRESPIAGGGRAVPFSYFLTTRYPPFGWRRIGFPVTEVVHNITKWEKGEGHMLKKNGQDS